MEMYENMLEKLIKQELTDTFYKFLDENAASIAENECYKLLIKIKSILENHDLEDEQCFDSIEEIVRAFEESGIGISGRHDFG